MVEGHTNNYYWIEAYDFGLHDIVSKCPELFVGKTVAITAFDNSPIIPNTKEKAFGWYSKNDVFYAPKIKNPKELPYDNYDEWYVFEELKEFLPDDLFVNYLSFSLRDPSYKLTEANPTWDKIALKYQIERQIELLDKFWNYIIRIEPRLFVLDGDNLIFGSRVYEDVNLIKDYLDL